MINESSRFVYFSRVISFAIFVADVQCWTNTVIRLQMKGECEWIAWAWHDLPIHRIAHECTEESFQDRNESRTEPHIFLFQIEHFIHNHQENTQWNIFRILNGTKSMSLSSIDFSPTSAWFSSTIENAGISRVKWIPGRVLVLFGFVRKIFPAFSTTLSETIAKPSPIFDTLFATFPGKDETPLTKPIDACLNGLTMVSIWLKRKHINHHSSFFDDQAKNKIDFSRAEKTTNMRWKSSSILFDRGAIEERETKSNWNKNSPKQTVDVKRS